MRALSPRVLRAMRDGLEDQLTGRGAPHDTLLREWIAAINGSLRAKRALAPARERRTAKNLTRCQEWGAVRTAVLERAAGVCEGCGAADPLDLQADHMFGGAGRRVSLESKFTVWALCFTCHQGKTLNQPDPQMWLRWFIRHAKARMAQAEDLGEAGGYCAAGDIAQARLDALEMQERAS